MFETLGFQVLFLKYISQLLILLGDDDLEIIEVKPAPNSLLNRKKMMPSAAMGGPGNAQAQALAQARAQLDMLANRGGANNRLLTDSMLNGMMGLSSQSLLGNPFSSSSLAGLGGDQSLLGLHAATAGLFNGTTTAGQLDILQKCKIFKFCPPHSSIFVSNLPNKHFSREFSISNNMSCCVKLV